MRYLVPRSPSTISFEIQTTQTIYVSVLLGILLWYFRAPWWSDDVRQEPLFQSENLPLCRAGRKDGWCLFRMIQVDLADDVAACDDYTLKLLKMIQDNDLVLFMNVYYVSQASHLVCYGSIWSLQMHADPCYVSCFAMIISYIFAISILLCLSMTWPLSYELSRPSLKQTNTWNHQWWASKSIDNRQSQSQASELPSFFHHVPSLCSQHHILDVAIHHGNTMAIHI